MKLKSSFQKEKEKKLKKERRAWNGDEQKKASRPKRKLDVIHLSNAPLFHFDKKTETICE